MIVPFDTRPEKSLHVIGAEVMSLLKMQNMGIHDVHVLYEKFIGFVKRDKRISFSYFVYALIWLYMLQLIDLNEEGKLVKCF